MKTQLYQPTDNQKRIIEWLRSCADKLENGEAVRVSFSARENRDLFTGANGVICAASKSFTTEIDINLEVLGGL